MPFLEEPFIRMNDSCCPMGLIQHHLHLEIGDAEAPLYLRLSQILFIVYGFRPLKYCMTD